MVKVEKYIPKYFKTSCGKILPTNLQLKMRKLSKLLRTLRKSVTRLKMVAQTNELTIYMVVDSVEGDISSRRMNISPIRQETKYQRTPLSQ